MLGYVPQHHSSPTPQLSCLLHGPQRLRLAALAETASRGDPRYSLQIALMPRTRASKLCGLMTYRRTPSCSARSLSFGEEDVVSTTTGMVLKEGDCCISPKTVHPSSRGVFRSSRTRSGVLAMSYWPTFLRKASACSPSQTR